jgi:hypothetical protein
MKHTKETAVKWVEQRSPRGRFHLFRRHISEALGALRDAGVAGGGHPFDVELARLPPGATNLSGCQRVGRGFAPAMRLQPSQPVIVSFARRESRTNSRIQAQPTFSIMSSLTTRPPMSSFTRTLTSGS